MLNDIVFRAELQQLFLQFLSAFLLMPVGQEWQVQWFLLRFLPYLVADI